MTTSTRPIDTTHLYCTVPTLARYLLTEINNGHVKAGAASVVPDPELPSCSAVCFSLVDENNIECKEFKLMAAWAYLEYGLMPPICLVTDDLASCMGGAH